jgi:DNA-binding MarR family transcriptional regulator
MPEVSARRTDLDAVVADLLELLQAAARGVPDWLTRELTIGQLKLLFVLGRDGALSMGRIAETFNVSLAAASGLVDRIEQQGLVARRHRSDDRRVVECVLTERGRQFIAELSGIRSEALKRSLSTLEPMELAEFHQLLRLIHLRQHGQGHSA